MKITTDKNTLRLEITGVSRDEEWLRTVGRIKLPGELVKSLEDLIRKEYYIAVKLNEQD